MTSVCYSLILSNYYQSESVLQVSQEDVNSKLGQLSSLSSLAGFNLGNMDSDKSLQAMELIQSRTFLKHLLTFENILPMLMAVKKYDLKKNAITFNESLFNSDTREWKQNSNFKNSKPSYLEAYKSYKEMVYVSKMKSGFISLKVEHLSPYFAKDFLELIISEVNSLMRKEELEKTEAAREYLEKQLQKSRLIEVNSAISSLIEMNLKKEVTAKLDKFYVLKPIEEPFIPEKKSKPSRGLICILGTFLGFILVCIFLLVQRELKKNR